MPHKDPAVRKAYQHKRWLARSPEEKAAELARLAAWNADPENRKKSQHKYYHEGGGKQKQAEWRQENRDKINTKARDAYHADPDATRAMRRAAYGKTRMELLKLLGARCAQCGYDADVRALQFDHIHNDGAADRRRFKIQSTMYRYYLKHPAEARRRLQTLCANCNFIKAQEALPT